MQHLPFTKKEMLIKVPQGARQFGPRGGMTLAEAVKRFRDAHFARNRYVRLQLA